jgi:poly-gamma-glutamate capsule biosynthesis protein CapA/YwtB (metallophosphatase superfamily)
LQTKQIDYCGAIENSVSDRFIIKEINSLKIAILCYGSIDSSNLSTDKKSGLLPMDEQSLKSDLKKALQKASVAVVLFNNEADDEKGVSQSRAFSYAAIDYGASLVVGQSGAGRQSNELYKGKQVFLNLGNFLGGQQAGEDGYSLVLKVLLSKDGAQQFDYFVTKVVDWQVVLAAENESNEVLKNVIRK